MDNRRSPSSLLSKLLQHDPFDDPFFRSTHFSSFFDSPFFSSQAKQENLRIEEVPVEGSSSRPRAPSPIVEHPDDDVHLGSRDLGQWMQMPNLANHEGAYTFSSSSVCYDGPKGAYYAATKTRRGGPQGVVEERFEEQDSTTNKHMKRMSRGLGNKGHSFTCQRDNKTGKVEENEVLHNLAEEEVHNFDKKWEHEAEKYLPGWNKSKDILRGKSKSLQGGRSMRSLPSKSQNP